MDPDCAGSCITPLPEVLTHMGLRRRPQAWGLGSSALGVAITQLCILTGSNYPLISSALHSEVQPARPLCSAKLSKHPLCTQHLGKRSRRLARDPASEETLCLPRPSWLLPQNNRSWITSVKGQATVGTL